MARNVGKSFMENLNASIMAVECAGKKLHIVKYVIPKDKIDELRNCLERFHITPKLIYPDLEGLAKSVNSTIYSQSRNVSN